MTDLQKSLCKKVLKSGDEKGIRAACLQSINAAWFLDRDNSMSDVNDDASKALYILSSKRGRVVLTQICPGVFVTVAHAAISNKVLSYKGEALKKFLASRAGERIRIYSFPYTRGKYFNGESINFEYFGERLSKPEAFNNPFDGYLILKLKPLEAKAYAKSKGFRYNPEYYITPVSAFAEKIKRASDNKEIDIHLYRGRTRFNFDNEAKTPVINEEGHF